MNRFAKNRCIGHSCLVLLQIGIGLVTLSTSPACVDNSLITTITFTTKDATDGVFIRPNDLVGEMADRGALHVSGSESVNYYDKSQGLSVTFIRFDTTSTITQIEEMCEGFEWSISGVTLALTECQYPNNPRFNRGEGQFDVTWLADDSWDESTLVWDDPNTYLQDPNNAIIGTFSNAGIGNQYIPRQRFELNVPDLLVEDLLDDGTISFYLSPADEQIGFVFNSEDITDERIKPYLEIDVVISKTPIDACTLYIERTGPLAGDLDLNCTVDLRDFVIFANNWLKEI